MSWWLWVIIFIVGPIGLFILVKLISTAIFSSYFEEKIKHDCKGDQFDEEEKWKKR